MTSAELAALAARSQLYGAWWPPFSPKCTIVSHRTPRHRRQRRPVLCLLKAVLSVTSHSRTYCRWGRHCLHTCPTVATLDCCNTVFYFWLFFISLADFSRDYSRLDQVPYTSSKDALGNCEHGTFYCDGVIIIIIIMRRTIIRIGLFNTVYYSICILTWAVLTCELASVWF